MCLCHIVSGNICYVKSALKTHDKTTWKRKRMVLFIRIEVYNWVLPDKSQTKTVMST